jgi:hypothetical protein
MQINRGFNQTLWQRTAICTVVLALSGCISMPVDKGAPGVAVDAGTLRQPALRAVFALIEADEFADASRQINRMLARDPENAGLHLLNGFVYYRLYLAGDRAQAEHAETGLQLALQFDASLHQAHELLGLLYLDMRRFDQARVQFLAAGHRHAPENALALAHAAYYARDIPLAVWAIDQYLALRPDDADGRQASAIIHAAAGSDARVSADLAGLAGSAAELPRLKRRVEDWRGVLQRARDSREALAAPAATQNLSRQAAPPPAVPPGAPPSPGGMALARSWSDCAQSLQSAQGGYGGGSSSYGGSSYGSYGSQGGGDVAALPALPSPCDGVPLPRMAILDVMIVRTQEVVGYGNGINLLTGLNLLLGYNWSKTRNTGSNTEPSWTGTLARTASLSNAANGIQYSLNIFGVGDSHAEVIARPSLIALDRVGSTFFSGSTVSVSVSSQYGGNSLQDKNIGVSMSVTPTFIDDETMLLAVKTGRSFAEPIETGNFSESMSVSTNTVTANALLRFGETMVLSGLREREVSSAESGVPVLNRVPLVQYLFNRKTESDYAKHVLVLVTPRKPAKFQELLSDGERHRDEMEHIGRRGTLPAEVAETIGRQSQTHESNLRAITAKMGLNKYYQEFKTGDLNPRRFHAPGSLDRILMDIRQVLYY